MYDTPNKTAKDCGFPELSRLWAKWVSGLKATVTSTAVSGIKCESSLQNSSIKVSNLWHSHCSYDICANRSAPTVPYSPEHGMLPTAENSTVPCTVDTVDELCECWTAAHRCSRAFWRSRWNTRQPQPSAEPPSVLLLYRVHCEFSRLEAAVSPHSSPTATHPSVTAADDSWHLHIKSRVKRSEYNE